MGIVILLLTGCASGPSVNNNAARDAVDPRAALYKRKCISCHSPVNPSDHSDEEWPEILEDHQDRLNLSVEDKARLIEYLTENN
jgi:hypothetical protein